MVRQMMLGVLILLFMGSSVFASEVTLVPFVRDVTEETEYLVSVRLEELGMTISFLHDGEFLYLSMTGSPVGWMSVGFIHENGKMNGANILLARFINDSWTVENHRGVGFNHQKVDWPEKASFRLQVEEDLVYARMQYPLAFANGYALSGLVPGETYTLIVALSKVAGLRNHGRPLRTSFPFILEGGE